MFRFLRYFVVVLGLAAAVAVVAVLAGSADPYYALQEWIYGRRYASFDEQIVRSGKRYGVDPMLVKAIVWRESRFSPEMVGTSGERGLMQVTEAAGRDWARAEKIETFAPTDLFDPQTNLNAGTWYVSKAAERWKAKDDPLPFTLAEYNAGRRRVDRWISEAKKQDQVTSAEFLRAMDFPNTRRYVDEVTARYRFYQKRGRL